MSSCSFSLYSKETDKYIIKYANLSNSVFVFILPILALPFILVLLALVGIFIVLSLPKPPRIYNSNELQVSQGLLVL